MVKPRLEVTEIQITVGFGYAGKTLYWRKGMGADMKKAVLHLFTRKGNYMRNHETSLIYRMVVSLKKNLLETRYGTDP